MEQLALSVHQLVAEAVGPLTRHDIHAELLSDEIDTEEQLHEQLSLLYAVIELAGVQF